MKIISNMIEAHVFKESKDGIEFLLLKRSEGEIYPGLWQMVNGSIEQNEKAYETALREIKEETGLVPEKFWTAPNVNSFYSHEKNCMMILPVFAAKVNGKIPVKICEEHCDFKWSKPEEAKKLLAWQGQRKSVDIITQYYLKEIDFLNFIEIEINLQK